MPRLLIVFAGLIASVGVASAQTPAPPPAAAMERVEGIGGFIVAAGEKDAIGAAGAR